MQAPSHAAAPLRPTLHIAEDRDPHQQGDDGDRRGQDSVEGQVACLEAVPDDVDPTLIAAALDDIPRAHGVSQFARQTRLSREKVFKALKPDGNPTLETMTKALKALGIKLPLISTLAFGAHPWTALYVFEFSGAAGGNRTHDIQLGKLTFYL